MKVIMGASVAVVLAVTGSASADVCFGPGAGGTILDFPGAGVSSSIVVTPQQSVQIQSIDIMINGLQHTWAGDLLMTLQFNGGPGVNFVNRPGVPATTFGDSTNYGANYTFTDAGPLALDLEAALAPLGDNDVLPPGTYFDPGGSSLGAAFAGQNAAGTWTLTITDLAVGDVGSFTNWNFCVVAVPAPGAAGLLMLGGLVAARRRRA
jgi:MYXO-CTERM domain-containing protein